MNRKWFYMKKWMLYLSFILLIVFECLRVYLIMPMPGSQTFNSIDLAYFLGSNKNVIRIILYLIIFNTLYKNYKRKFNLGKSWVGYFKSCIYRHFLCIYFRNGSR